MHPRKKLKCLFWSGILLFALPFLIYGISRMTGNLPSKEVWYSQGMNHGPWRWKWQSILLYLPILFPIVTLVSAFLDYWKKENPYFRKGLRLVLLHLLLGPIPLLVLIWTID